MLVSRDPRQLALAKRHQGPVKKSTFVVTATSAGMHTHAAFNVSLEARHCKSTPYFLWLLLLAAALLCLCLSYLCLSQQSKTETQNPAYTPLQVSEPEKLVPLIPTKDTWVLRNSLIRKGQSDRFVKDVEDGQVGSQTTRLGTNGLPLTFDTPAGETLTVIALMKPLGLTYARQGPIEIGAEQNGHGKELGIQVGWKLVGIDYCDITQRNFDEVDKFLRRKEGELPGAAMPVRPAEKLEVAPTYDPAVAWVLRSSVIKKGQSNKFAKQVDDGQAGSKKTFFGTEGLPLTFETPAGETLTVIALNKPIRLLYDRQAPIKISSEQNGHGKELGIEVGWKLVGIDYSDITQKNFDEADKILQVKVDKLPFHIPMKWTRNNSETKTVYAYYRPLGLTYQTSQLPIKITDDGSGHGDEIGIKKGWELQAVNYRDVTQMTDLKAVSKILQEEVSKLPLKQS